MNGLFFLPRYDILSFPRRICKYCDRVEWYADDKRTWYVEESVHFIVLMKNFRENPDMYNEIVKYE